ncbi:MAG: hypothetical protein E6929_07290 [Clostridium sp.]|nr:hypothetical protein [Clostridium sp.]
MKRKKRKVTLIPYGFIGMMGLYLLEVYVFKFEEQSIQFKITSLLAFISMVVMFIHIIRIIKQFYRDDKEENGTFFYQAWKSDYSRKNPEHNKTEDELMAIFYEERKAIEFERNKAKIERSQALKEKRLAEAERKKEMERLRNAGRTVSPYEQPNYQPVQDNNVARCPKCGSTSLTANKKGFSVTKGVVGLAVSPLAGAVAGGAGRNKVIVTCLKCGHQWKAGKK